MACKISSLNPPPRPLPALRTKPTRTAHLAVTWAGGGDPGAAAAATAPPCPAGLCRVEFRTLPGCELGISRYPDFAYDASGGAGTGGGEEGGAGDSVSVSFDVGTLYIPPLTGATTRFLGLPLPPFLRIDIVPELFRGLIDRGTGQVRPLPYSALLTVAQVDLDFRARFCFSVGSIYRAPPLMVETKLTSESSEGSVRSGRGRRLDGEGLCRLVGVAKVEPIGDLLMDSFLSLPTECITRLNAQISFSEDSAISGQEQAAAAAAPRVD
ncbi:hypothetical protein Taro_025741 [Colocasia esculenta]|uniref:Uncharacterized protein n=1 Tax=Colocasia esculenta TaxID=4460 RepID=A0A843VF44_COLES|nr:hypothetical protein [Colocasia esculenta]